MGTITIRLSDIESLVLEQAVQESGVEVQDVIGVIIDGWVYQYNFLKPAIRSQNGSQESVESAGRPVK